MSKFTKTLSSSNAEIKEARATALAESTVLEVEAFIQNLKREKSQLKNKLTNLTDLAPDNTYCLRPGSKDFNPVAWMKELHETRMNIKLKDIELGEAEAIYNEWFAPTESED